jgi:putative FmdB family regulatory protein
MTVAICSNEELTPMPLYEYECDTCGHRFEIIQKFSDPPIEKCPKCGGSVHKLMSSPAFQFKGSGWYVTDYPKKDQAGGPKSDQKNESAAKDNEKSEKAEKADKADKAEKADKADKAEKADKADRAEKTDKSSASSGDSTSTSSSTTSTTPKSKD